MIYFGQQKLTHDDIPYTSNIFYKYTNTCITISMIISRNRVLMLNYKYTWNDDIHNFTNTKCLKIKYLHEYV